MLYIDDKLPQHPKILTAGAQLGKHGRGRAIAVFLDGLSYTRRYLTDGRIPRSVVAALPDPSPIDVANALVKARLWHRLKDGYRIHDYHDWNKSAGQLRDIREKWRAKKQRQRRGTNGKYSGGFSEESRGGQYRDSRARVPQATIHVRTSTTKPRSRGTGTRSVSVLTDAARRNFPTKTKTPTHRIVSAIVRAEFEADCGVAYDELVERVKVRIARQGYAYPIGSAIADAIEAVEHATKRRIA